MRIATWNVNGLRARQDFLLHWLKTREPDVVALQELKLPDEQFPHDLFAHAGYQALVHGAEELERRGRCCARKPIAPVQIGLPGQEEMGARWLGGRGGGDRVRERLLPERQAHRARRLRAKARLVRHARRPPRGAPSRRRAARARRRLQRLPLGARQLGRGRAGRSDLPHRRRTRALPRACSTGASSTCSARSTPSCAAFSWWDYRAGAFHKGEGLRIDFLLGTAPVLAPRARRRRSTATSARSRASSRPPTTRR